MILASSFIILATVMLLAAVLALFGVTNVSLYGSDAIKRDGLYRGSQAPSWALADEHGKLHSSPPTTNLQLIVFTDHSLKSFPLVAQGLRELVDREQLETVVILRGPNEIARPMLDLLGLEDIPLIVGTLGLYAQYNVRVMPWLMFVDSDGRVRASSLVNYEWQVDKLWRLANVPLQSTKPELVSALTMDKLQGEI